MGYGQEKKRSCCGEAGTQGRVKKCGCPDEETDARTAQRNCPTRGAGKVEAEEIVISVLPQLGIAVSILTESPAYCRTAG